MAQPIAPAFDPSKPFTEVPQPSATATPPAFDPSKPFTEEPSAAVQAPPFDPAKAHDNEFSLDDFRKADEATLASESEFNPVLFGSQNREALLNDPAAFDKLTRVYRAKETKGTTLGQKLKNVVKGTPMAIKALASGVGAGLEAVAELNPVTLAARIAGAASVGDARGLDLELRDIAGKEAEVVAAIESAGAGTGDLFRRSARAVKEGAGKVIPGVDSKAEKSDADWKTRLRDDVAGFEQVEAVARGSGEAVKALGVDADALGEIGVTLDPKNIQDLSVVADPINFIPFGAAVGAVSKVGGKLGTRILAKTLTSQQAAKLAEYLNSAREILSQGQDLAAAGAGKTADVVGGAVTKAGEVAEKVTRSLGGAGAGVGLGGVLGGDIVAALGGGAIAKAGPRIVQATGRGIQSAGKVLSGATPVPKALSVAGDVASEVAKGTAEGAVLSLPFILGAREDEEQLILGAAGVGGLARAGATQVPRAAKAAGRAAQERLAETIFREAELPDVPESQPYGADPNLDTQHASAAAQLDPKSRKLLDATRDAFRDSGIEIYALDDAAFQRRAGTGDAFGFAVNIGERVDTTGNATPVTQIFLNGSTEALPHELFHALMDVDPKGAKALADSVMKSWTPEQREQYSNLYNTLRNGGAPKELWKHVLDEEGIAEEAGAEVFSRLYLGQDLSGVSPSIVQKAALFASTVLEKLGIPLGALGRQRGEAGVSTFGIRPGAEPTRVGQEWLANLSKRLEERGSILPETRTPSKTLQTAQLEGGDISRTKVLAVSPSTPKPITEVLPPGPLSTRAAEAVKTPATPPAPTVTPNVRVSRKQQDDFAAKRAAVTNVEAARAAELPPQVKQHVETISAALESGRGVVEIEHSGVRSESTAAGRTERRAEQEAAYIAEGQAAAPTEIREAYQKTFVPVRWETVKGKPQLLAMSLDKVIANVHRVVKDSFAKNVADKIPYEVVDGKLTDNGWGQVVDDLQSYAANQANGYRGDGRPLVRPTTDIGVSIPEQNPAYNPVQLTEERMNFLNLVQGLNPPLTARTTKGTPANVKGQIVSELQGRTPQTPSVIRPEDIQKQGFKGTGRSIKETNPLRNELAAAGVPVRELIEVTERINSDDILSARSREDLNFQAPVTDVIRAGFLPGKETVDAMRTGMLADPQPSSPTPSKEIRDLSASYAKSAGIDYRPSRNYSAVNPDLAKRLADFYEAETSNPADPAVAKSYKALADETMAQYRAIQEAGYTIEPFTGKGEPYKSSAEAVADIRDNKHLYFLKTEGAFGSGAETGGNALLADAGNGLVVNDVFRAVHDFFGHGKEGYQFGPRGEFNAWRAHSEMYSPAAQGALAAETLAQNSWVNFGKHLRDAAGNIPQKGQPGYVPVTERPFAEQKNLVIPDSLISEARAAAAAEPKFLPDGKSLEDFGKEILDLSPTDWQKATESWDGGLTGQAYRLGLDATDRNYVETLARLRDEASAKFKEAIAAGDLDNAMPFATKSQLFSEAHGAATGGKSARNGMKRLGMDTSKIPFPEGGEAKFLPKTAAGKALAKDGYDFRITGNVGRRDVVITKDGVVVGEIMSAANTGKITEADIVSATVDKSVRGKKVGEAGYRELLAQLKEDGVKKVGGTVVAPQPIAIRRNIFGEENTQIRGPRGEMTSEEALAEFAKAGVHPSFFEVVNKIRPEQQFLPAGDFSAAVDPIDSAAIRTTGGRIFTGGWHVEAMMKFIDAVSEGTIDEKLPKGVKTLSELLEGEMPDGFIEDGFVTKGGKFLNRAQALDHAEKIGQLRTDVKPGRGSFQESGILESNEFRGKRAFAPKPKQSRDAQGRPLTEDGLVDYEQLYKEKTEKQAKVEAKDLKALEKKVAKGKYTMPKGASSTKGVTGWILPNKSFVALDTAFHEEFLAKNSEQLNEQFGTKFTDKTDETERLDALNKGFARVRYTPDGRLNVELAASRWGANKAAVLKHIEQHVDQIDRISLTLLDERGGVVDTVLENVTEFDGPERLNALTDAVNSVRARGPRFAPSDESLPGLDIPSEAQAIQNRLKSKIKTNREKFPETLPLQYRTDENGNFIVKGDGKPAVVAVDYDLMSSPLAKEAAKGLRGEARDEAFASRLAEELKSYHDTTSKNPDVKAGAKWYSTARTRLKKLLGDDSKFFAELLGATSARTPVDINFRFALDAYNRFKQGEYDDLLAKYREGKTKWETGDIAEFRKTWKGEEEPTRGQFLDWWVDKHDLVPTQSNGKKFGANSRPVLRVLDGSWASEVQGPKTPNFAGNLSGMTFEATIDVWAMRTLHRLANEGRKDRWRILPENETGVSDSDFFLGQKAFRKAADAIGIKPDALQAIIWFAEKDLWEKRGWTRGAGAEKSDFNTLLAQSERTPSGKIRVKTAQEELDFFVKPEEIKSKK